MLDYTLSYLLKLRYVEDIRTLSFCLIYFTFVTYQWIELENENSFISKHFSLIFWLTSFIAFQGAVTVHNAVHCPIFKQSELKNSLFHVVLSMWFGHCAATYVPGHNLSHHRNLQTRKDIMRTTKMKFKWNFLNGLFFMPTILISTEKNDANYFNAQKRLNRDIYKQLKLEAFGYVTLQVILVLINPTKWLWIFWLPHLVGKYCIISLNMLQHDGTDTESKYNHSRNFVGPILNYLCFNNGFHGIHHIYPGKHWALLKVEHNERIKPFIHKKLDEPNLISYIVEAFIYPGVRLRYDGKPVKVVKDGPDEPWFYDTYEAYSDRNNDKRVWDKKVQQKGVDDNDNDYKPVGSNVNGGFSIRSAKSYSLMKTE